jgi:DNA-directed RNA polymerase subunit RPC12/RpoP
MSDPKERPSLEELRDPAEGNGLVCPKCNCTNFAVNYTRRKKNSIVRLRVCRNCGSKLLTRETPAFH